MHVPLHFTPPDAPCLHTPHRPSGDYHRTTTTPHDLRCTCPYLRCTWRSLLCNTAATHKASRSPTSCYLRCTCPHSKRNSRIVQAASRLNVTSRHRRTDLPAIFGALQTCLASPGASRRRSRLKHVCAHARKLHGHSGAQQPVIFAPCNPPRKTPHPVKLSAPSV